MHPVLKDLEHRMKKAVDFVAHEMAGVRSGRASPAILEGVMVEYYGSKMPVTQLATINVPEPTLIIIQPWDVNIIDEIQKAIMQSDLGLMPSSDGKIIRVPVPPLSEERRQELVKAVKKMAEEAKVAIRNIRREGRDKLNNMKKNGDLPEDECFKLMDELQKLTDKYIERIEEILAEKEREILEV